MTDDREVTGLYNIFFNRLRITIGRNGIVMYQDVRKRREWMEEMLKASETAVFEELDEESVYGDMIDYMKECGWTQREMSLWFRKITKHGLNTVGAK